MSGPRVTFTQYAVDRSDRYRDRIYRIWPDESTGVPRITLQYSSDRGLTWSAPRMADGAAPLTAWQYQPAIAVNNDGVVGITWFDTRSAGDFSRYDEYFSASLDGGDTFAPAVRVSTESSAPQTAANRALTVSAFAVDDSLWIRFVAAGGRWVQGGDYMGLTADAAGNFHPFWADSRGETFQIYTATVRVSEREAPPRPPVTAAVRTLSPKEFAVVFNPVRYDSATSVLSVSLQVRNKGPELRGPLVMTFVLARSHGEVVVADDAPVFLNATNGLRGEGAAYDLTAAIGGDGTLATGAITSPVTIRIKVRDPVQVSALIVLVTAAVAK
jgi:hypothetical protein